MSALNEVWNQRDDEKMDLKEEAAAAASLMPFERESPQRDRIHKHEDRRPTQAEISALLISPWRPSETSLCFELQQKQSVLSSLILINYLCQNCRKAKKTWKWKHLRPDLRITKKPDKIRLFFFHFKNSKKYLISTNSPKFQRFLFD